MPRPRTRSMTARRGWGSAERSWLEMGYDFVERSAWHAYDAVAASEIPKDILADIEGAWRQFGDDLMAEFANDLIYWCGRRPWGWWAFDAPERRDESRDEREQLEALGLLTAAELSELRQRAESAGEGNYMHSDPFRRSWSWWRFVAPERRNRKISEAEQLVRLGGDILNPRERHIVGHKRDFSEIQKQFRRLPDDTSHLRHLSDAERKFLGLRARET